MSEELEPNQLEEHSSTRPFTDLLTRAVEQGGLSSEDLRNALLPLWREVAGLHDVGFVAPLRGLDQLRVDSQFRVTCTAPGGAVPLDTLPSRNRTKLNQIQKPASVAFDVLSEHRVTHDIDLGLEGVDTLDVVDPRAAIERPVFVPGYEVWEHRIDHHDQAADIESLGMILASLALGLDFRRTGDLERFASYRRNLFVLRDDLHPVLARLIGEMAEPDRNRRTQDLASLADRLETYRDQPLDFDLALVAGATAGPVRSRRSAIQSALRDRLFEINRRNRLVYFQPSQQSLNLTLGSVPLLLDVRNIGPDQIATWKAPLADVVVAGKSVSLGSLLRFEDAPYLPGVLDKLIAQARRDRNEYGIAQLRLVVCFLRWHNLKEVKEERINSPLLLLPVEITKKRGVRDAYTMTASSSVAEVNPALRHHLRQVYGIELPEEIDLETENVGAIFDLLAAQIRSSEPGVTLTKVDRPQLELFQRRAQLRVDQYRRRQRASAVGNPRINLSYSYGPGPIRPHGIQLFDEHVRYRSPDTLRLAAGAAPATRQPHLTAEEPLTSAATPTPTSTVVREFERTSYALKDSTTGNPYEWEFDLCALTVANFNYRKMTLVRDYTHLIASDEVSDSFDRIFSLDARPVDDAPSSSTPLTQQHLVVPADETQRAAIDRSRSGRSFIIQGPPGTGKSQTITNLIADYVARGMRVLFVCEKRAAIDVVHARLRSRGLDDLCAVIHDSQADKKPFIQGLKSTYERWLSEDDGIASVEAERQDVVESMQRRLRSLERVSGAMAERPAGSDWSLRQIYQRAIEVGPDDVVAGIGRMPTVEQWRSQQDAVRRIGATLQRLGEPPVLALHPIAETNRAVLSADRPADELVRRSGRVRDTFNALFPVLIDHGLDPTTLTNADLESLEMLCRQTNSMPLSAWGVLDERSDAFRSLTDAQITQHQLQAQVQEARAATANWRDPLSPEDARNGLALARDKEDSALKFLSGAWRGLKKTVESRYDFSAHAVRPSVASVLELLLALYAAEASVEADRVEAVGRFGTAELDGLLDALRPLHRIAAGPVAEFRERVAHGHARDLPTVAAVVSDAREACDSLFERGVDRTLDDLRSRADRLRGSVGSMTELLADLRTVSTTPEVAEALRTVPLSPDAMELAVLEQAIAYFADTNADVERFTGYELELHLAALRGDLGRLMDLNAQLIRARVRTNFREHAALSSASAAQLSAEQKAFKKIYSTGRRDLEHEFSKTMRYRSIRDLASSETGPVVMDLRPIWLMSPLSVSDTLPLDPALFDVVVFDEASQIPLEEAIPALYRSHQTIVVGDQMQLPPTQFFSSGAPSDDEVDTEDDEGTRVSIVLDGDSFLAQSSAGLPSTMLQWHYRSRSEELIGFSNAAFYGGALATVPDRHRVTEGLAPIVVSAGVSAGVSVGSPVGSPVESSVDPSDEISVDPGAGPTVDADAAADATLARNISFHFIEGSVYESRRNAKEADYIAEMVRVLLARQTGLTIGIAAFSEAQQTEIEEALERVAQRDPLFATQLEAEELREDDGQFVGLFVKNLENIQGDERDVIIMSVCYGPGPSGRMLMNFGPINQRGGEKRLNVIFSRARRHMAIVSSIRSSQITNEHNDGASALRRFLEYAEALSIGDQARADTVLAAVNPAGRRGLAATTASPVPGAIAAGLRERGLLVDLDYGRSRFRCDLAVRRADDHDHRLAVLIDTEQRSTLGSVEERALTHPMILTAFGWNVVHVLTKDWWNQPDTVLRTIEEALAAPDAEAS